MIKEIFFKKELLIIKKLENKRDELMKENFDLSAKLEHFNYKFDDIEKILRGRNWTREEGIELINIIRCGMKEEVNFNVKWKKEGLLVI